MKKQPQYRIEKDLLGELEVPVDALHGIHTERAQVNFRLAERPVAAELVRAFGAVKLACTRTNRRLGYLPDEISTALETACLEMQVGSLDAHVQLDALQGGAGTSMNMNVNEVLANRALCLMGAAPGDYARVDPLAHVNLHQSTNDTFPTALRIAAIRLLRELEGEVVSLQEAFQEKEKEFAEIVKMGRTELQDAVLLTVGREMSAYAEAIARDRWRIYKCEERLRVVNLGGTAIGTGLGAPRDYIFQVVEELRGLTGIGVARAENLVDATQNTDVFVEVSGILKALAANLVKIANDLRWLSSGPDCGLGELRLPPRQAGSSIMPGKVNPVVPEAVVQAGFMVMGLDSALTSACAAGNLELNAFMPLIADSLLTELQLLRNACRALCRLCVSGMAVDRSVCQQQVHNATAAVTALAAALGYEAAQALAADAAASRRPLREVAVEKGLLSAEEYDTLTSPEAVTRLGGKPTGQA
jgi:aspartate ammonia-lyase